MGYFANGTEGEIYQELYCDRCIHRGGERRPPCMVWFLQLEHNYEDLESDNRAIDVLIPRHESGVGNHKCTMFVEDQDAPDPRQEVFDL